MLPGDCVNNAYLIVLGRDAPLSIAELCTLNQARQLHWNIQPFWSNACLIEGNLNAHEVQEQVGGTVKIAQVLFQTDALTPSLFDSKLASVFSSLEDRFHYGFSFFGNVNNQDRSFLINYFKAVFKDQQVKAMYKAPKSHGEPNQNSLQPTEIFSRGLLDSGFDFCLAKKNQTYYFCRTITATNAKELQNRDKKRLVQTKVAAISIRLGRILVNLTGLTAGQTLLDPFCGVGTILQEARLVGLNVIGIDKDPAAIKACRKNLSYLQRTAGETQLHDGDATILLSKLQLSFDAVASEPELGPYRTALPSIATAEKTVSELEPLYYQLFFALARATRPRQRVVIILPEYPTIQGRNIKVSNRVFEENGFVSINPIPFPEFQRAFPYLYRNESNKINRYIHVLERTKEKTLSKPKP